MSEIRKTIMAYLNRSAGNCNHPSLHTIRCFVGMIQTGEATIDDFVATGGAEIVSMMREAAIENDWGKLEKQ